MFLLKRLPYKATYLLVDFIRARRLTIIFLYPQKTNLTDGRRITECLVSSLTVWDSVVSVHANNNIFYCLVKSKPDTLECYIAVRWVFSKNGPMPASFCLFSSFSNHNSNINWKSVDFVLEDRTRDCKLVGTDGSTELWWLPPVGVLCSIFISLSNHLSLCHFYSLILTIKSQIWFVTFFKILENKI